jgi:hypothetical protein
MSALPAALLPDFNPIEQAWSKIKEILCATRGQIPRYSRSCHHPGSRRSQPFRMLSLGSTTAVTGYTNYETALADGQKYTLALQNPADGKSF